MVKNPEGVSKDEQLMIELDNHYQMWTQDNDKRMTRKDGWNDITDAYYGVLPKDWPYQTRITDPRIRTTLIEKNARLLNSRLRGTLAPRENGDAISAAVNNTILDYQWDNANHSGSMLIKLSISDMDTRLYGSKFALVPWLYEVDSSGKCIFDGNELIPLDLRDCGIEPTASHIRDAKWFQHRTWEFVEDLEKQTDAKGLPTFKNLDLLKKKLTEKLHKKRSSTRTTEYVPRVKTLRGMEDRTGEDLAFPVVKLVTEYRRDRWITFSPDFHIIIRDIPNPYDHGKIPVSQLRYYPLQDDPIGESEVESVLPLWRAIQATVCGYMDESILKMRPPLKILEGAARIETIQYGPEAQWLMSRIDAVQEMQSSGDSVQYFQTTYQALVAAFNVAMGDLSQGVNSLEPFQNNPKTATEVRASVRQQNVRDQKNQMDLAEFIKDVMSMWLANNKQFLFSEPEKVEHVVRITGQEKYNLFKRAELDKMELPRESAQMIADIITQNPDITDAEIEELYETASIPKYPVVLNPKEKDPTKLMVKPKLSISKIGDMAELSVVPEDLDGTFDYIPDVKSMSVGASEELAESRSKAIALLTQNQLILSLLAQEGWRPNVKELIQSELDGLNGMSDSSRFFTKINDQTLQTQGSPQTMGGANAPMEVPGMPGMAQANAGGGLPEQMAGSSAGGIGGSVL